MEWVATIFDTIVEELDKVNVRFQVICGLDPQEFIEYSQSRLGMKYLDSGDLHG